MESSVKELSKYRFERAKEDLEDAQIMFDAGRQSKDFSAKSIDKR